LDELLFNKKLSIFFYKTSYLKEDVKCTEPLKSCLPWPMVAGKVSKQPEQGRQAGPMSSIHIFSAVNEFKFFGQSRCIIIS
jgi:hypothetical protein